MSEDERTDDVELEEVAEEVDPLVAVAKERDEYLDALQRLKAEFDNFRKRTESERAAQAVRASEGLVKELQPAIDDFARTDIGRAFDDTWQHVQGYPGVKSPDIKEWFKEHTVVAGNYLAAYP